MVFVDLVLLRVTWWFWWLILFCLRFACDGALLCMIGLNLGVLCWGGFCGLVWFSGVVWVEWCLV